MTKRSILFLLAGLTMVAPAAFARTVKDPARAAHLVEDYILQEMKAQQQAAIKKQDEDKKKAQDGIAELIGSPVAAKLNSEQTLKAPDDKGFTDAKQAVSENVDPNSPLGQYLAWAEKRRVAQAAMDAQLNALMKANDGKPLDWTGHLKLATQTQALQNDRLSLSINEANIAAETRVKLAARKAAAEADELRRDARADAERRLGRP